MVYTLGCFDQVSCVDQSEDLGLIQLVGGRWSKARSLLECGDE